MVQMKVSKIIDFLYNEQKLKEHILCLDRDKTEPTELLELCLETKVVNEDTKELEMIVLDNRLDVNTVLNLLWYAIHPSSYEVGDTNMRIMYRRKKARSLDEKATHQ